MQADPGARRDAPWPICTVVARQGRAVHGIGTGRRRIVAPGQRSEVTMDRRPIEDLARKLAESVPPGVRAMQADLEKNFRALLEAGFARMNLVTREEFEVQQRVLERTREKLAELEARLQALQDKPRQGGAG
jgi:hypothetical protein